MVRMIKIEGENNHCDLSRDVYVYNRLPDKDDTIILRDRTLEDHSCKTFGVFGMKGCLDRLYMMLWDTLSEAKQLCSTYTQLLKDVIERDIVDRQGLGYNMDSSEEYTECSYGGVKVIFYRNPTKPYISINTVDGNDTMECTIFLKMHELYYLTKYMEQRYDFSSFEAKSPKNYSGDYFF